MRLSVAGGKVLRPDMTVKGPKLLIDPGRGEILE